MKKTLLIITSLLFYTSIVFSQSKVNINNLSDYGGKMFKENDDKPYTGLVFDLYRTTGNKSLEGRYKDGLRNGKWSWWNEDNKMDSSGTYKIGIKDRKWIHSTDIGNGKYEVKYTKGNIDLVTFTDNLGQTYSGIPLNEEPKADGQYLGQEHEYNFSKYPEIFATIKNGKEDGLGVGWYENGQKSHERNYKNGKLNGLYTFWYENGQKNLEETYKDGKNDGLSTWWYENGQKEWEQNYKDGERDGLWTDWHENGQKAYEETYKDGKNDGLWTDWHENGQKKSEETYKDGIQIGKYQYWLDDGTKEWEYYYNDDGTRDTTKLTTRWYESGQKWYAGYIKTLNDTTSVWNGLNTEWYENGQKESEGTYKDGELDGLYTNWHENGQKKWERTYKDGKRISIKCWDKDGNERDCN